MRELTLAYHEAGHAVAACRLGFDVKKVTIIPTDQAAGSMLPRGYLQFRRLEWETFTGARLGRYHDHMVAGTEAQRRYNPRSVRSLHLHHKGSDYSRVVELLFRLHGHDDDECRAAFRYLRIRTRNLVMNWVRIEGLAKALIERKTLSGDEVREVFQASLDAQLEKETRELETKE
jgi:ATP-dependent Zn protease